jgi:hypothetical protein
MITGLSYTSSISMPVVRGAANQIPDMPIDRGYPAVYDFAV